MSDPPVALPVQPDEDIALRELGAVQVPRRVGPRPQLEHHRREPLSGRYLVAPDYPGFGRSPALAGSTTFDRLADAIDVFTEAKRLKRFGLYMFDFGSPVGFSIATRHPERVQGLVLQNGNAYEVGLGPELVA